MKSEEEETTEETQEVETEETETEETEETESGGGGGGDKFDEARAKAKIKKANDEAKGLRDRLKQLEDKDKSESEKLTERVGNAESEAKSAKKEVARLRVALKKGLTETQAKRLVGDTEEELEQDADELLKQFSSEEETQEVETEEEKGRGGKSRPKEKLKPGASPSSEPDENDPRKLAESVPPAY